MLFSLRYRRSFGVAQSYIELEKPSGDDEKDLETARQIGMKWCAQQPGYRFVTVERAVVATEKLLLPEKPAAEPVPDRSAPATTEGKARAAAGRVGA